MITVVDYGVGNLFSLRSSLSFLGETVLVTGETEKIRCADKLILPGVGAFGDAVRKLRAGGLDAAILEATGRGVPLLGICLGMQLLFEKSYEYGEHSGLGLLAGSVVPIDSLTHGSVKIPHIGWNAIDFPEDRARSPLFSQIHPGDFVYFVHSYCGVDCKASLCATTQYGVSLTAAVEQDHIYGTQFHPEKSGEVGLSILRAFCEL